jgi:drug/metabolite transporter (DMT)-like permease
LFGLVSGLLSLLCHALMAVMGLGPLDAAFFLWDAALEKGDARQIGILSYFTPLASTALLIVVTGRPLTWSIGLATALIIGAAVLGARSK